MIAAFRCGYEDWYIVLLEAGADHLIKDRVIKKIIFILFIYLLFLTIYLFLIDKLER